MKVRTSLKKKVLTGLAVFLVLAAAVLPTAHVVAEPGVSIPIDLNSAGPEALATLPGIGSVKAEAIVSFRSENGPFSSVEGLLAVPGIGPRLLDSVRELIAVSTR